MPRKANPGASKPGKKKAAPKRQAPKENRYVRPAERYMDWHETLVHLHLELARFGMKAEHLPRGTEQVLRELEGGTDEDAISKIYQWWILNREKLFERGRGSGGESPRISLQLYFTRKGYLALEWEPEGLVLNKPGPDCDFVHWCGSDSYAWSRPENELICIRGLHDIATEFNRARKPYKIEDIPDFLGQRDESQREETRREWERERRQYVRERKAIDATLLQAAERLVREVRQRLENNLEVRMVTDIFTECDEVKDETRLMGKRDVLVKWEIESVRARRERFELAQLDGFAKEYGVSLEEFVEAFKAADANKLGKEHTRIDRVSRALKKQGHKAMTPKVVATYWGYIERYRPGMVPKKPEPPKTDGDPKVVPFKRKRVPRDRPL